MSELKFSKEGLPHTLESCGSTIPRPTESEQESVDLVPSFYILKVGSPALAYCLYEKGAGRSTNQYEIESVTAEAIITDRG